MPPPLLLARGLPYRLSRFGRFDDIKCKCGRNALMSFPYITQACGLVSGLRTMSHNHVPQILNLVRRHHGASVPN